MKEMVFHFPHIEEDVFISDISVKKGDEVCLIEPYALVHVVSRIRHMIIRGSNGYSALTHVFLEKKKADKP